MCGVESCVINLLVHFSSLRNQLQLKFTLTFWQNMCHHSLNSITHKFFPAGRCTPSLGSWSLSIFEWHISRKIDWTWGSHSMATTFPWYHTIGFFPVGVCKAYRLPNQSQRRWWFATTNNWSTWYSYCGYVSKNMARNWISIGYPMCDWWCTRRSILKHLRKLEAFPFTIKQIDWKYLKK